MPIERTLHCKICRKNTLHSVRKERTLFTSSQEVTDKRDSVVEQVAYSKICLNHKHKHPVEKQVSVAEWKELLKAGIDWEV